MPIHAADALTLPSKAMGQGYVVLGGPYLSNSAGIYCLHRLCHELNRLGYHSLVSLGSSSIAVDASQQAPGMQAPMIDWHTAKDLCASGYVAVYPETVKGNPWKARKVARWVLNRPGLLGGDAVYDETEKVFCYSDLFLPYVKNAVVGKLHMPTIRQDLFFNDPTDQRPRSFDCYYVGKSQWKEGACDPKQTFEITRGTPPKQELGKLFRATRILYCFDNSTILVYEALLCGCKVVVIPDGTQTKQDYDQLELGTEGIAWGVEEISQTVSNVPALQKRYAKLEADFQDQLQQFIAQTQDAAGTKVVQTSPRPVSIWKRSIRELRFKARGLEQRVRGWKKRLLQANWLQRLQGRAVFQTASQSEPVIVIVLPADQKWLSNCAPLLRLADALKQQGANVCVTSEALASQIGKRSDAIDWQVAQRMAAVGASVLYCESTLGNPLHGRVVARWVLRPPTSKALASWEPWDQIYGSSRALCKQLESKKAELLSANAMDAALFYPGIVEPAQRRLDCFYVGGGTWQEGLVDRNLAFEITPFVPPQKELGKLLRATRKLYTFDYFSDITRAAILCGSEVIVASGEESLCDDEVTTAATWQTQVERLRLAMKPA